MVRKEKNASAAPLAMRVKGGRGGGKLAVKAGAKRGKFRGKVVFDYSRWGRVCIRHFWASKLKMVLLQTLVQGPSKQGNLGIRSTLVVC